MNKFNEFNKIKTPEDWKNININQKQSKHVYLTTKLGFALICFMICLSSIGFVYAIKKDFRVWIREQFQSEKIEEIPTPSFNEENPSKEMHFNVIDIFMYTYYEENDNCIIKDVSVFEEGEFVLKVINHIEGIYNNQVYSFDYVKYEDHIFTFNEKGFTFDILPLTKENVVYFNSSDCNLCSLNLETNEIMKLTNDNDSVNSRISPNKTYITINKKDKYWTVYNTVTQKEKILKGLDPYAHREEYDFYQEKYIICYDENSESCLIDLETNEIISLNEQCLYPEASTFTLDFKDNETVIKDIYMKEEYMIKNDFSQYRYTVLGKYIIFDSFQDKKIIIVDFHKKCHKSIDYKGTEENIRISFLNQKYLFITNDKESYIIKLDEIFS